MNHTFALLPALLLAPLAALTFEYPAPQENLWVYSGGIGRSPKA